MSTLTVAELIDIATSGKHREPELLQNYASYKVANTLYTGTKRVALAFKKTAENVFKQYIKSIRSGDVDITLLMSYNLLNYCYEFYVEEVNIIVHMLKEFDLYARSGHIVNTYLLLRDRAEEDQYDYIDAKNGNSLQV